MHDACSLHACKGLSWANLLGLYHRLRALNTMSFPSSGYGYISVDFQQLLDGARNHAKDSANFAGTPRATDRSSRIGMQARYISWRDLKQRVMPRSAIHFMLLSVD